MKSELIHVKYDVKYNVKFIIMFNKVNGFVVTKMQHI